MRRQTVLPFTFCAALLLGPAAACADDAEDAAQALESLFGNDVKNARATPDARDDADLAARLLDTARKTQGQPAFAALLCEKAYELGGTTPAGYATAAAALELLAQTAVDRAAGCAERLLEVRQKQFDAARGDEKKAAGEALLACLAPAAEAKEKSGALPEAAALCRRMQTVAAAIDSPRRAEIDARADALALKMKVARQIADVTAMLARDPRNVGAREGLVRLYLVDLDDPAGAARHLAGVADETLLKYVPAAAKGIEAAPEVACTELADWYRGLAETAPAAAKAAMYARAKAYLARFLEIHPAQDLDRTRATLALAKTEDAAAKLAAPPKPAPKTTAPKPKETKPAEQWIDLLALVDPAKDAASGTWQREGRSLVLAVSSGVARITLPVVPAGDYEIEVLFNRAAGDDALGVLLPTGSSRVLALLSAGRGKAHGLAYVNGQHATTGETAYKPGTIQNNRDHRLSICVRTAGEQAAVAVVLDGVSIITWQGPQSALSQYENWALPNPQCLGLAASEGNKVTYLAVRLKMLSGEARPLRP